MEAFSYFQLFMLVTFLLILLRAPAVCLILTSNAALSMSMTSSYDVDFLLA